MSQRPSGLGRGLGSLIPTKKPAADFISDPKLHEVMESGDSISHIKLDQISPNPHQPRKNFDDEALKDLSKSIAEHGIIQPLVLTRRAGDRYELIAGERRLRAAKLAGLTTVPAIVREMSEQKKMELALIENLQREDLNALEIAIAYKKLEDEFNLTREELSKRVGKSLSAVANSLRLLNLRDEVKEAIMDGRLTEGHARALAGLSYEDQLSAMDQIINNKFTVREAEEARKRVKSGNKAPFTTPRRSPEIKAMEDELAANLGTKVEIKNQGGSGAITIKYFSNDELREIVDKIIY